ncbi:glycoside hydrolase family 28 protein [Sphingobacterium pedocola]|uniref:Exo-poly-alpha-D-galacturonosidase n=1 Tax=Sphingobacterium pedocola TaxID=2082722 RepID=A0ABR9T3L9_9SPHI|nr:glycoside hydrolase family 28 protein [Sphingobacterium pedocola]MBE8719943.1 exo-poly-alpha-D-galacturonosidase [Sphingobacterium pedocola]
MKSKIRISFLYKPVLLGLCFCLIFISSGHAVQDATWLSHVGVRKLSIPDVTFLANDYGAIQDGKTLNTLAIQRAIDSCAIQGGGKVVFAKGRYLTGSIYLKSNVELHIGEGVELIGSQHLSDYPEIQTRVAGVEMKWPSALINIIAQRNAAVTGAGVIDGQGKPFWDAYRALREDYEGKQLRWIVDYDAKRPRTLLVDSSWDILIEDVTFRRAGFWTVHILYSSYVTVDGIIVQNNIGGHGPSTDGIDIDSSSWILVQNADIDCNDDNFCIKSGRDWDGLRINRPTEYVLIQNCLSRRGGGLITFGSETSGGMRHIIARNLRAKGTKVGIRFKSATNRGGIIENIKLQNILLDSVGVAIDINSDWHRSYSYSVLPEGYERSKLPDHWIKMLEPILPAERGIPTFRNIEISGLQAKNVRVAIKAKGLESSPLDHFQLRDVVIYADQAGSVNYAKNWSIDNVSIKAQDGTNPKVTNSEGVTF